jgi:hypothetical protein
MTSVHSREARRVMTNRNLRFSSLALPLLSAITIGFSLAIVVLMDIWHPTFAVEAVWYLLLVMVFVAIRPFKDMIARLPRGYQLSLLVFGLALLSAQFLGGGRHTYPVVRWAMFNDPVFEARATIYVGVTTSGERVLLHPMSLVPSLRNGRFTSKLRFSYEAAAAASLSEGATKEESTEFDQLLRSLARIHNRSNTEDPILAVEVSSYSTLTGPYLDRSQHDRTVLWRTEV